MRLAGCYERAWYGRHSERSGKFDRGSGGCGGYISRAADISAMADMADILVEIRKVWENDMSMSPPLLDCKFEFTNL